MTTQETWKKVNYPNVKNCYEISSHGNFRNININKPRKLNNHVDNLEWMTQSENTQHYYNELRTV